MPHKRSARAFTPSLARQSAPDADVEAYLARQMKFDPDAWIVEVEDRAGRNFLDIIAGCDASGRAATLAGSRRARPGAAALMAPGRALRWVSSSQASG